MFGGVYGQFATLRGGSSSITKVGHYCFIFEPVPHCDNTGESCWFSTTKLDHCQGLRAYVRIWTRFEPPWASLDIHTAVTSASHWCSQGRSTRFDWPPSLLCVCMVCYWWIPLNFSPFSAKTGPISRGDDVACSSARYDVQKKKKQN